MHIVCDFFVLLVPLFDERKNGVTVPGKFGQLMADILVYVSCKFEMYIFEIAQVIDENVPIAFLYVLSIQLIDNGQYTFLLDPVKRSQLVSICDQANDAETIVVRKPVFGVSDQVPHKPGRLLEARNFVFRK